MKISKLKEIKESTDSELRILLETATKQIKLLISEDEVLSDVNSVSKISFQLFPNYKFTLF